MLFMKVGYPARAAKWEQEVAPLGCGDCGAHSHAAHCFCIDGLQDHCDLPAAAGLLVRI